MTSPSQETAAAAATPATVTLQSYIEQGNRAFALLKFEEAVGHYGAALEIQTKEHGEDGPKTADLYVLYGRALLENAIQQSSVLGKEQPEEPAEEQNNVASGSGKEGNGPILSFSGDVEDMDGEDRPVDLFGKAAQEEEEEDEEEEGGDEDGEPEDDYNAAWDVLDLARAIYEKHKDDDEDTIKLKLADTYIMLGDVSLETEKFDQAITDYEAGLKLKVDLLPTSSRQIAEAHYKLCIVLDLTSGRLSDSIMHAEKAFESLESRLAELRTGLAGQLPEPSEPPKNTKGKGKSTGVIRNDYLHNMSKSQIESEIKEVSGLRDEMALKVEELKTLPNEGLATSAPALAAQALDRELGTGPSISSAPATTVVNDLTSIVKKKKKAPEDPNGSKRKAEGDAEPLNIDKKARLDDSKPQA